MNIFRIPEHLWSTIHRDLDRPHAFAWERVGFLTCGVAALPDGGLLICAGEYHPVADADYERDSRAAAMLGAGAFRKILQKAYSKPASIIHIHRHDGRGRPFPSQVDVIESRKFVPDFFKVCPNHPHGTVILSFDALQGSVWLDGGKRIVPFDRLSVVGDPLRISDEGNR